MGTSTRRTIPRLKNKIKENINDDKFSLNDIKKINKEVLMPRGKYSNISKNIIKSASSPNFIKSIRSIINISNNYNKYGLSGIGINGFEKYSHNEQIDLLADYIVPFEEPELKQILKDIFYENGIENMLKDSYELIKDILYKKVVTHYEGIIAEMESLEQEHINIEDLYAKIDLLAKNSVDVFFNTNNYNSLLINISDEIYVENWLVNVTQSIIKGVTI